MVVAQPSRRVSRLFLLQDHIFQQELGEDSKWEGIERRGAVRLEEVVPSHLNYEALPISLNNFSAQASANAGSLMCRSSSISSTLGAIQLRTLWNSAASASGHQNGFPSASIAETPRSGSSTAVGPLRGARLLGDLLAEPVLLLRRRPHQRDGRVVLVEAPALVPLRHRLGRAEVHHVERPDRNHLRHALERRGREPVRPGGEHAADEFVGEFGRGDVEHAGDRARRGSSPSIVRPPVPVAWNTSTSYPAASRICRAASTHGVVTPNMVAATSGLSGRPGASAPGVLRCDAPGSQGLDQQYDG